MSNTIEPTSAHRQLVDELQRAVEPLGVLVGELVQHEVAQALQSRCEDVLEALRGEGGKATAVAIMAVVWGSGEPPALWWRTPLGRLIGPLLPDAPITHQVAADILGVKRGTVGELVKRTALATVDAPRPSGPGRPTTTRQVSRSSVLERLDRLCTPPHTTMKKRPR